jgi:hypothetical protein
VRRSDTWTIAVIGLLLVFGFVGNSLGAHAQPPCVGGQGNPNHPGPAGNHGPGTVCGAGVNSNIPAFLPIYLELTNLDANGCPDPSTGIAASPEKAVMHRGHLPNRIIWIAQNKDAFPGSVWEFSGGDAVWDDFVPSSKTPFATGTIGAGADNAYWTDAADLPTGGAWRSGHDLIWKYQVKVTNINSGGKQCPDVEVDPIVLFPGG